MSILAVDEVANTFDHFCAAPGCGAIRRGLRLDPAKGDLTPWHDQTTGAITALVVRVCPLCRSSDSLNIDIPPWEAQETDPATGALIQHPGALTGATFTDPKSGRTTAIVREHHHGYLPTPDHVAAARLVRRIQRHPLVASVAPVVELRPDCYAALCRPFLGAAAHAAQEVALARAAHNGQIAFALPGETPEQALAAGSVTTPEANQ